MIVFTTEYSDFGEELEYEEKLQIFNCIYLYVYSRICELKKRWRYKCKKNKKCSIVVFGETGRSTSEYLFLDKYIYVEELREYYSYPIYIDYTRPVDILYRTLNEYIIYKDKVYLLEGGYFKKTENKLPVNSLEEIDKAMEE